MRQNAQCFYGISNFFKSVKSDHNAKFGNVYFAITGQNTAGAILPLDEPDWLHWSCDVDDMLGLGYCPSHVT